MNILIISGSRNPEGQTARTVRAFAEGVSDAGGKTEIVFLPEMQIERCRQCNDDGWGICRTEGTCTIDDDFAQLVDKVKAADAVVFATPVYFSDLSESIRAFLDRLRRTCISEGGREQYQGKPVVGICVAGGGGGGAPACAVRLEHILSKPGFDIVDIIPVRRQNLEVKLPMIRAMGRWLAKS